MLTIALNTKGITMHPTNWNDWYDLVKALAQHAVDRFGLSEVQKWRFECWNEMWGMDFPHPYMTLYNASATAIKSVGVNLRIGGPATMQLQHAEDFMNAAKEMGAPFDFVSTHMYPTDPQCPQNHPGWGPDCLPDNVKATRELVMKVRKTLALTLKNLAIGMVLTLTLIGGRGPTPFDRV